MILLDTNVLSELMKTTPDSQVQAWINTQLISTLFISTITQAEIEYGIALLPNGKRKQDLQATAKQMFAKFSGRCLVFGETAATYYGEIAAQRARKGKPINLQDAQIAAIALAHGLTLSTRNTKDFIGISGLTLINPWGS